MATPILGITYLVESQSGKVVTINTALDKLDTEASITRLTEISFFFGKTPSTGADGQVFIVPHGPGGEVYIYNLKKFTIRQETTGSSATQIKVQKATSTGDFASTATDCCTAVSISSSAYEASTTSFSTTVSSGDKIRLNVTQVGTGSGVYNASLVIQRQ